MTAQYVREGWREIWSDDGSTVVGLILIGIVTLPVLARLWATSRSADR
jgi:hypothetical protein